MSNQGRNFAILLFRDSSSWDYEAVLASCRSYFKQWAYILHDVDTKEDGSLDKPHFHIFGSLDYPVTPLTVSNAIGIPSQWIEIISKNNPSAENKAVQGFLRYLIHDGWPDKFQYPADEVLSNFAWTDSLSYHDPAQDFGRIF